MYQDDLDLGVDPLHLEEATVIRRTREHRDLETLVIEDTMRAPARRGWRARQVAAAKTETRA